MLYITVPPADYCNCCNYSVIDTQPLFAISASFNACVGNNEAPQACSCSAQSLEVSISYYKVDTCLLLYYVPYYAHKWLNAAL